MNNPKQKKVVQIVVIITIAVVLMGMIAPLMAAAGK